jgi:hypothetical protein
MLGRNCSRSASSPARSQSCQNRTNPPTKFGSWRSFAPARQCFSGLSLSTCALGQTQWKRKRNACDTGSRKLGFCLEIRVCQPLRLGYSKSFGPHRQETGKRFSEKLLSVCIPLIFLLHLNTSNSVQSVVRLHRPEVLGMDPHSRTKPWRRPWDEGVPRRHKPNCSVRRAASRRGGCAADNQPRACPHAPSVLARL